MAEDPVLAARDLLRRERSAVLCTLHADLDGWPFGSVVPYAVLPDGDVLVFVSDIAEHTKNLQRHPRASLFVADPAASAQPQAGARLTLLVKASRPDGADAAAAEACYFARFPDAAAMRQAHGFAIWRLAVDRIRWIAGFGSMGWIERAAWTRAPHPRR